MNKGLAVIGLLFLWACQPTPSDGDLVRNLVVTTNYYEDAKNFAGYSTYYLALDTLSYFNNEDPVAADTLQCICPNNPNGEYSNTLGSFAQFVTAQVQGKLDSLGYSQIAKKKNADFWVYVFVIDNYSVSQSVGYNPYGGYGGFYGGYGGYYPVTTVSENEDLWIYIIDIKQSSVVWTCDIGDISASLGNASSPANVLTHAINQAFKQSSYIKK